MDLTEIEKIIKENELKVILLGTPDANGNFRGRGVWPEHFLKTICDEGLGICDCIYNMCTLDGIHENTRECPWYPSWEDGYRDYVIKPDLSTFGLVPWLEKTGAVIGDVYDQHTGKILETAPRALLKRMIEKADRRGYRLVMASELEFILFPESISEIAAGDFRNIKRMSPGAYDYSLYRLSVHYELLEYIRENMEKRGIPVDTFQVEAAGGQFELQLRHADALVAADRAFLYKSGVKELSARRGLTASFMAKFDSNDFGNGCHVHQSLLDRETGRNLFWDSNRAHNISELMDYYNGGLLATLTDFTLMWAPYVNSYKRFGPGTAAAFNQSWGIDNRTTAVRALPESPDGCRLEQRAPGADVNPYVAMAGMIAGGLYGIENRIEPPEITVGNAYDLSPGKAGRLPGTLGEAVEIFRASRMARECFGDEFVEYYAEFKHCEWNEFCAHVTGWERRKYMEMA